MLDPKRLQASTKFYQRYDKIIQESFILRLRGVDEIEAQETKSQTTVRMETCENNRAHHSDDVVRRVSAHHPAIDHREWECLGHCHNCFRKPFVLVDERILLEADCAEDLYELLLYTLKSLESPPLIT